MQPFFARPPFGVGAGASRTLVRVDGEDDRWRFRLDGDEIGEEGVPGTNEGLPVGIWGQGMSALCGRGRLERDEARGEQVVSGGRHGPGAPEGTSREPLPLLLFAVCYCRGNRPPSW